MELIDLWGHIGYLLIALGMYFISEKIRAGWALRFLGEGIWIGLGFQLGLTSIWLWGIIFCIIDVNGFVKWSKNENKFSEK